MLCLSDARCGKPLRVEMIMGDSDFKSKMTVQGIFPGSVITLVSGKRRNPCILSSGDNTIIMDSFSAEHIYVTAD
jgi:Fe2+ transport system protein FeoA